MDIISVSVNGKLCFNPHHSEELVEALKTTGFRINGFKNRGGNNYGYGYFLLLQSDIEELLEATSFTVVIRQEDDQNTSADVDVTIKQLYLQDSWAFAPTESGDPGLFILKLVDYRFLSQKEPRRLDIDPFPNHPRFGDNDLSADTYNEAFERYWNSSNMAVSYDKVTLETDFPVTLFRDVRTQQNQSSWDQLNECLGILSHRVYKLWDKFAVYHNGYSQSVNVDLVNKNKNRLISIQQDVTDDRAFLPGLIRVKFRELEGNILNFNLTKNLVFEHLYSGDDPTVTNHVQDIDVYNLFDPYYRDMEAYRKEMRTMAAKIAALYFASFPNHDRYNATYFGVIPFAPGPDADCIEFYHDLDDGEYKTKIHSLNVAELVYPIIESNPSTTDHYLCIPQVGTSIPARVGQTPGSARCCIYRIEPTTGRIEPVIIDSKHYREPVFNIYDKKVVYNFHHISRLKSGQFVNEYPLETTIDGIPADDIPEPDPDGGTTTTTPDPNQPNVCDGNCLHIWDNTLKVWEVDTDGCGFVTTTTTTTTPPVGTTTSTTTTTTTTTTPCLCPLEGPATTTTTPCLGQCQWEFSSTGSLTLEFDPCTESCPCAEPTPDFISEEEVYLTDCGSALTTTTPCVGECEWIYSEFTDGLVLDVNPCTMDCPCEEPTPEFLSSNLIYRTFCGSGLTTTTPQVCACLHPTFCGTVNGQETKTYCSVFQNEPPICTPCVCTTTSPPLMGSDCSGCDFLFLPLIGFVLIDMNCSGPECSRLCLGPGLFAGMDACSTAHTECGRPPGGGSPHFCRNSCTYVFDPLSGKWVSASSFCSHDSATACFCTPPSGIGTDCAIATVPCLSPDELDPCDLFCSTSTTTPGVGTTTTTTAGLTACCITEGSEQFCVNFPSPEACTMAGGTAIAPSGTDCMEVQMMTGGDPCNPPCIGQCVWEGDGVTWLNISDECESDCSCSEPVSTPSNGLLESTACVKGDPPVGLCCNGIITGPCLADLPQTSCQHEANQGDWTEGSFDCSMSPCTTTTTPLSVCCNGVITGPCVENLDQTSCESFPNSGLFVLGVDCSTPCPTSTPVGCASGAPACVYSCVNGQWVLVTPCASTCSCIGISGGCSSGDSYMSACISLL